MQSRIFHTKPVFITPPFDTIFEKTRLTGSADSEQSSVKLLGVLTESTVWRTDWMPQRGITPWQSKTVVLRFWWCELLISAYSAVDCWQSSSDRLSFNYTPLAAINRAVVVWCKTGRRQHQLPTCPPLIDGRCISPMLSARDLRI